MINPKVFKQVRKALGLTQEELADALGLSRVTINKMERGKLRRGIPDEIAARLMALKAKPNVKHEVNPFEGAPIITDQPFHSDDLWDNEEDES